MLQAITSVGLEMSYSSADTFQRQGNEVKGYFGSPTHVAGDPVQVNSVYYSVGRINDETLLME
jgi:hypothetical protein